MSYSKIVPIDDCCLSNQSPVVVVKGCIAFNDDKTKAVLRLTMKNTGEKYTGAVGVRINIYDSTGSKLGNTIKYWYRNVDAEKNAVFGNNVRIPVDNNAASFRCETGAVVFTDKTVWQGESLLKDSIDIGAAEVKSEAEEKPVRKPEVASGEPAKIELSPEELAIIEAEKKARAEKRRKIFAKTGIIGGAAVLVAAAAFVTVKIVIPNAKYNNAVSLLNEGKYDEAAAAFSEMDGYKDSSEKVSECHELKLDSLYKQANELMTSAKYDEAIALFRELDGYMDSNEKIAECEDTMIENEYQSAVDALNSGNYEQAKATFEKLDGYKESAENMRECSYQMALAFLDAKDYENASELFDELEDYKDSGTKSKEADYQYGLSLWTAKKYDQSNAVFEKLGDYKDSKSKIHVHEYSETITLEPTCTEKGIKTLLCSVCGNEYDEDVPALGHSYDKIAVTREPTCTASGVRTFTCRCGDLKEEAIPATGHTYQSAVTAQASCTNPGTITYTCHCGDAYTESIPATGHDFSNATCWEPQECRICGYTNGQSLGHTTKKGYCTRCRLYIRDGEEWDSYEDWYTYMYDDEDYYDEYGDWW